MTSAGHRAMPLDDRTFQELCSIAFAALSDDIDDWVRRRRNLALLAFAGASLAVVGVILRSPAPLIIGILLGLMFLLMFLNTKVKTRITKLGAVGLAFQEYPLQDGRVVVDRSGIIAPVQFHYPSLPSTTIAAIAVTLESLRSRLSHMPLVLTPDASTDEAPGVEETDVLRHLDALLNSYREARTFHEALPIVRASSELHRFFPQSASFGSPPPLRPSIPHDDLRQRIAAIEGVSSSHDQGHAATVDIDELSAQVIALLFRFAPRYNQTLDVSLRDINYTYARLHDERVSDLAFQYYCPHCNAEAIQRIRDNHYPHTVSAAYPYAFASATRMRLVDPLKREWQCPICKNRSLTPFPVHKLDDQLFKPVYERLSEENRVERLRIYNSIADQKRSYAEKAEVQMQTVMREQRTKADAIKSKLRSINAEITADQMAIAQLSAILLKYQQMGKDRAREFEQEIDSIKTRIAQRTKEQQELLDKEHARIKQEMNATLEQHKVLEREMDRKKFELQQRMAESLDVIKNIKVAEADRMGLFDRSNWNPANWGYNLRRSAAKFGGQVSGAGEYKTAQQLPLN